MPRKKVKDLSPEGWKDFAQYTHTTWRTGIEAEFPRHDVHLMAFRVWASSVAEDGREDVHFNAILRVGPNTLDRMYRYTRTVQATDIRGPLEKHADAVLA